MTIEYRFLSKEQVPAIYRCFEEAFADYHLDMSYMSLESWRNRMTKNSVDFNVSVGGFSDDKMVGATLIGIDQWGNQKAAFDAGTGIIPAFRGQGIAGKMFNFSLPGLKKIGVSAFLLEVLQVNDAAVKAYKKTGFEVTREFDCFQLKLEEFRPPRLKSDGIVIRPVGKEYLEHFSSRVDWQPSWENGFAAMDRIPDDFLYGAFDGETGIGVLGYYPGLNWITTLVVDKPYRRRGAGGQLIAHCLSQLPGDLKTVKLVNVLHTDNGMIQFLEGLGFKVYVTQFEMAFSLQ